MNSSLDSLVDNLFEINNKTCTTCNEKDKSTQYWEFVTLDKNKNRLMYKCLKCKDMSYKPIEPLIKKFSNTYRLCMNDHEKFILLLRKGVYPFEYIDNWKRFYKIMLPSKLKFHSNLNMKVLVVKITNMQKMYGIYLT